MALFLGTVLNRIDAKGRVSVPADFRLAVRSGDFQGVVLYHSFTAKCIEGCTMERMEKLSAAADSLDLFAEETQNLNSLIFSDARPLAFDVTGRIVVPADLVKFAGLASEAMFVGKGGTFQVWEPGNFARALEAERDRAQKLRPSLSFRRD